MLPLQQLLTFLFFTSQILFNSSQLADNTVAEIEIERETVGLVQLKMVARSPPPRQRKITAAPLNPLLLRETVIKVEKCMARLQELQYTVTGGSKVIAGVTLSPRSTRGYLKTSLRCKQESLRIKNSASKKSPPGKYPGSKSEGEWKRMSLPAMLVGETVGEILQASQFAREIVEAVSNKNKNKIMSEDPKTPVPLKQKLSAENSELRVRRKREKRALQPIRAEPNAPSAQRAKSRINFKVSPPKKVELNKDKENQRHTANRISPKHRPWAKKTVLFPNPLFISTPSKQQHKFGKTRSPIIPRSRQTPHKFLIKTPPAKNKSPMLASTSKFQVKIKSPPLSISPTRGRAITINKKSPKKSISPTRAVTISRKSTKMSKLRRSLSPARLANRLMSPMKSRKSVQKYDVPMSGLKQRPSSSPMRFLIRRI